MTQLVSALQRTFSDVCARAERRQLRTRSAFRMGAGLVLVGLLVPTALTCTAQGATRPTIEADVVVDGDIDANTGESWLDRHRDEWSVELSGGSFSRATVAFGSGVIVHRLPNLAKRRLIGKLFVTTVPDPSKGLGTEDAPSGQASSSTQYSVRLPAGHHAQVTHLDVAGSDSVRVSWRARGGVSITGLPANTVRVEFQTAGTVGVGLLTLAPACRHSDRLAGARVDLYAPPHWITAHIPSSPSDRCGSMPANRTP